MIVTDYTELLAIDTKTGENLIIPIRDIHQHFTFFLPWAGREYDSQYFIAPEWFVVSGDEAVRNKAEEFGLKVLSNSQFAALIDEAGAEQEGSRSGG